MSANASVRVSVNVIRVAEQERFAREIEQVRSALGSGATLSPTSYLEVGCRVHVASGPFEGLEGLIEARARADRLVLQVSALGRAMSLEIDASLLDPVD